MDETTFQSFVNLVELDQKIDQLGKESLVLEKESETLNKQIAEIQQKTESTYKIFHDLRKSVDELELEQEALQELKKDKKYKLGMAANPKEFFSLESEITVIEKKVAETDEKGLELINQLEIAEKQYEQVKAQEPALLEEKRIALAEKEKRLAYVGQLKHAYVEQHVKYEDAVPKELLEKYLSMKERVPNPAVEILKDSCSACFYAVSKADLLEAEKHQLITCKDCYRLLYKVRYGQQQDS